MGRGVDAPMLDRVHRRDRGLASVRDLGLFVGAVVMVVAYQLLRAWLEFEREAASTSPSSHRASG
jgi:hypothetical protein